MPNEFRLELLTDIDMLLMVEKGIRGGITQAIKRYAKANNKYLKDLYNPDEESIYLQQVDANNLYGWVHGWICGTHQGTRSSVKAWFKIKKGTPGH